MGRSSPWLLFAITFAGAMTIAVALVAATGNWWILPAALAVHFLGFWFVVGVTWRMLQQTTKPDPVTEAKRDEEGAVSERVRREQQVRRSETRHLTDEGRQWRRTTI